MSFICIVQGEKQTDIPDDLRSTKIVLDPISVQDKLCSAVYVRTGHSYCPPIDYEYTGTSGQYGVYKNMAHMSRYTRHLEESYLAQMRHLISLPPVQSRNGLICSDFQWSFRTDLSDGFPLFSTRRAFIRGIIGELLFFLRGETDSRILEKQGIRIWSGNTTKEFLAGRGLDYEPGDMGPMYGWVWRHFGAKYRGMDQCYKGEGFDQLNDVIETLLTDPLSRRIMMTTFDPSKVKESVLAPCHSVITQFNVRDTQAGRYLDMFTYQRSADMFHGVYFNIPSSALLLTLISHAVNMIPGVMHIQFGNCHVYESHREAVVEQLKRTPSDTFPTLEVNRSRLISSDPVGWLEGLSISDITVKDYHPQPAINVPMVV